MLFTFSTFIRKKIDTFQFLILRFISFIEANKKESFFFVIFTYILGQLYLNSDISFLYNKDVLSEDFSTLNAGEGYSQGSGQGPSREPGQWLSQESGQGQGSGQEPGPGGNNNKDPFLNPLMDSNLDTDTDRLANYLEQYRNQPLSRAGIHLSENYRNINFHDEHYSRIARFVHRTFPNTFNHRHGPGSTIIDNSLITLIRAIRENVPAGFNYY